MSNPLEGAYLGPYGAPNRSRGLFPGIGLNVPSGGFYWPLGGNLELIHKPGFWAPGGPGQAEDDLPLCFRIAGRLADLTGPGFPKARPGKGPKKGFRIDSRAYYELSDRGYGSDWESPLEGFIEALGDCLEAVPGGVRRMRIELIEIKPDLSYSFIVGAGERPDSSLRERVQEKLAEAMGALGKEPGSYGITFLRVDLDSPQASPMAQLLPDRDYLIIASLSVNDPNLLTDRELEEQREELKRGIILPAGSRAALVLLHNAIVRAIIGKDGKGGESVIIPPLDPIGTLGAWG